MLKQEEIRIRFEKVFPKKQAVVLTDVFLDYQEDLVKSGDFNELKEIVREQGQNIKELAEAQKGSEKRLTRLEATVKELAEAQKRTEEELKGLIKEHRKTREQLGGISDAVGYGLEDKIMPYMNKFGKDIYGIEVEVVDRRNIIYADGRYDEINIYIEGIKEGKKAYIIGECKSQPGKGDADEFHKLSERVKAHLKGEVNLFLAGYTYSPEVEKYIKTKYPEIRLFKSFEFEMKFG